MFNFDSQRKNLPLLPATNLGNQAYSDMKEAAYRGILVRSHT